VFLNALPKLLIVLFIIIYIGAVLVLFGYIGATNYETNHRQPFFNKKAFILILFIIRFTYLSHINNWASFLPKDLIINNRHSLNLLNHFLIDQRVFFFSLAIFIMLLVILTSRLISKNTRGTFRSI
jgi:NADH:ubiquinone oxidoreductase subunit 6 (subunit J)